MKKRADGRYVETITIDGKRRFIYGKSPAEVKKKLKAYEVEKETGPLFRDVAEKWWKEYEPTLARNSLSCLTPAYKRALGMFGDKYIREIRTAEIAKYINDFGKTHAMKTTSNQLSILRMVFRHAALEEIIDISPASVVSVPDGLKKKRRELPSPAELDAVKKSIDCTGGLLAYFIYYTGCRRGEALAMQYGDIDRENNVIHIRKSLSSYLDKNEIKTPKTEAGKRTVVLLDNLKKVLPIGAKDQYIFTNANGGLISTSEFRWLWIKYRRESGVSLSPHQLRHGFATLLYEAGIGILEAARMMGHTTKEMTEYYTHITDKQLQLSRDKLNSFVSGSQNVVNKRKYRFVRQIS